jgi:hypothetical protein
VLERLRGLDEDEAAGAPAPLRLGGHLLHGGGGATDRQRVSAKGDGAGPVQDDGRQDGGWGM